ncbi:hypothetical protein [Mycoplasma ovis]|uniref:hypothetical protein n=1 Tax=Mycoplasma ovis TaxID=171632 RepID=UPI00118389BC|nr:hypothetical protein [Mycoplasma ovis]
MAISLPTIGFFSNFSIINLSQPSGYYTQATLTIENGSSGGTTSISSWVDTWGISRDHQLIQIASSSRQPTIKPFDLVAEFPLKYLDKQNWWRYCLPKSSKLKNSGSQTSAMANSTTEKDCELNWWRKLNDSNSESIAYLLDLMLKFLINYSINLT